MAMKTTNRPNAGLPCWRASRGAGLIEVLVLIFVMGVGMLAMAKMHTILIRDGGTAHNRAVATSLAQEKLDDLRGFKWINAAQAAPNGDNCADDAIFCFSEIAPDAGGFIPAGDTVLGNTTFSLSWQCFLSDTVPDVPCTGPGDALDNVTFKRVVVSVAWTDQNGAHTVELASAIVKDDPLVTAFGAGGGGGAGGYGPKVEYTPGTAPDIVAVPIVQGAINKETSKPLPDVVTAGKSVATSFQTVTYEVGSPYYKQVLDDFVTVSCECKFTTDGAAYPASYYYWDAQAKALRVKYPADSATVNKPRGVPAVNGQHSLCTKCCRDHHDVAGDTTTALYDPERPDGDYTAGGDHKHYYYSTFLLGNPVYTEGLSAVTPAVDAKYLEACRFLRVDGFYRLMQDWYAKDLVVMPKENYLTVGSNLPTYQTYVRNVLRYHARVDCEAAEGSGCTAIDQASAPAKSDLVSRDIANASGSMQLLARAIYLDRVYGQDTPRDRDTAYYTELAARIAANQGDGDEVWLDIVPFNEVNVTLLASWYSSLPLLVSVSNQPIADITATDPNYYGVYSRGLARVLLFGSADIHAVLLPSTSGLTGGVTQGTYGPSTMMDYHADSPFNPMLLRIPYASEIGIDRHDHRSALRLTDSITVTTSAGAGLTGTVHAGNAAGVGHLGQVTVQAVRSSDGQVTTCSLSGEGNVRGFSCAVSSGFTGRLRISQSTGSGAFFDYGQDDAYGADEKADGYQNQSIEYFFVTGPQNAGVFWVFGTTAEVRGSLSCSSVEVCAQVQATTSDSVACTISGGTVVCPVTLAGDGMEWTGTVTLANKPGFNHNLSASASSCGADDGSAAKVTGSLTAGPTDLPSALTFCAASGSTLASCTLGATTVQSGESLTAYSAATFMWPATCTQNSETRWCDNGSLSGSYAYATCNPVTVAPAPSWTGTDPKHLAWSAIAGASGYKLYTCQTSNQAVLTPCANLSLTATVATPSYAPVPGNRDTICAQVRAAADGVSDSEASGVYCIYRQGSTYYYSP